MNISFINECSTPLNASLNKTCTWAISCLLLSCLSAIDAHSSDIPPACSSDNAMLNIVDRPSASFSPCTVPEKTLYIESGYTYLDLQPEGYGHSYPQEEWRLGLPYNTELEYFPPNYLRQFPGDIGGYGPNSVGLKHIFFFDARQIITLQGALTIPSGDRYYGTRKTLYTLNAVYNYNFDSGLGITLTAGGSSNTTAPIDNSELFYSVNPIALISWPVGSNVSPYVELYGSSKTAPDESWGLVFDTGIIFLVHKNITLDVVYGQKVEGNLNSIAHYVGTGVVLHLS